MSDGEGDLVFLVRLLHAGGLEVLQDHLGEVCVVASSALRFARGVDQFVVLVHAKHAMGREALDGERPGHADLLLVLVGLVVEVFELGLGGDGGVDLLLPGDALLATSRRAASWLRPATSRSASRGISHSSQFCFEQRRSASRAAAPASPATSPR